MIECAHSASQALRYPIAYGHEDKNQGYHTDDGTRHVKTCRRIIPTLPLHTMHTISGEVQTWARWCGSLCFMRVVCNLTILKKACTPSSMNSHIPNLIPQLASSREKAAAPTANIAKAHRTKPVQRVQFNALHTLHHLHQRPLRPQLVYCTHANEANPTHQRGKSNTPTNLGPMYCCQLLVLHSCSCSCSTHHPRPWKISLPARIHPACSQRHKTPTTSSIMRTAHP